MNKELAAKYIIPYWDTDIIYNESVFPLEEADGSIKPISLLFPIKEIISISDAFLKTTFTRGNDYDVDKEGRLVIIPSGKIRRTSFKEYYPEKPAEGSAFEHSDGGYIMFGEANTFHSRQIAVTYRKNEKALWEGPVPERQGSSFKSFFDKMKSNKPVNILFYGDSITTGANSSGMIGAEPFADNWCLMVTNALSEKYGSSNVNYINTAVGGTLSDWGLREAKERAADHNPDIAFIGFGMNCGSARMEPETYKANIKGIMAAVRTARPDCKFVLIGTTLPNREVRGFFGNQPLYIEMLNQIADENGRNGVAVADMTSMHAYLLTKKRFFDMTGNNVNHPNDFLARAYAQVILRALEA